MVWCDDNRLVVPVSNEILSSRLRVHMGRGCAEVILGRLLHIIASNLFYMLVKNSDQIVLATTVHKPDFRMHLPSCNYHSVAKTGVAVEANITFRRHADRDRRMS